MSEPETPIPEAPVAKESPERSFPFWDYVDLLLLVGAALPTLFAASVMVRVLFAAFNFWGQGKALEALAAQFLWYGFCFGFLYILFKLKYDRPFWESLGWFRFGEEFWRRAGTGAVVAIALAFVGALLRTPDLDMPMKRLMSDRTSLLLIGVAAATLGPVCEELAFRGFLMPLLVRSLGAWPGIVVSALPFALLHGPQYAWSWRHLLLIVIAGVSFGWMRHRTGSTAAAAVMHAGYNFTFFVAFVLQGKDVPTQW